MRVEFLRGGPSQTTRPYRRNYSAAGRIQCAPTRYCLNLGFKASDALQTAGRLELYVRCGLSPGLQYVRVNSVDGRKMNDRRSRHLRRDTSTFACLAVRTGRFPVASNPAWPSAVKLVAFQAHDGRWHQAGSPIILALFRNADLALSIMFSSDFERIARLTIIKSAMRHHCTKQLPGVNDQVVAVGLRVAVLVGEVLLEEAPLRRRSLSVREGHSIRHDGYPKLAFFVIHRP